MKIRCDNCGRKYEAGYAARTGRNVCPRCIQKRDFETKGQSKIPIEFKKKADEQ